eukprot:scaffold19602_cov21-Tisochrysis_lutea.AAC.1
MHVGTTTLQAHSRNIACVYSRSTVNVCMLAQLHCRLTPTTLPVCTADPLFMCPCWHTYAAGSLSQHSLCAQQIHSSCTCWHNYTAGSLPQHNPPAIEKENFFLYACSHFFPDCMVSSFLFSHPPASLPTRQTGDVHAGAVYL